LQNKVEEVLKYDFQDGNLLKMALTHSSYIQNPKDRIGKDNERLEFLGDAILDAVISIDLYTRFGMVGEGALSKTRARVVCEESLAAIARKLSLGEYIMLSEGERRGGGEDKDSILSDTLEALIGAIALDGGFPKAQEFIKQNFEASLIDAINKGAESDYKTSIQEVLQSEGKQDFEYRVVKEEGPAHAKMFYVELVLENATLGAGVGMSKKEAEQNAAKAALEGRDNIVL
jgi:ribonuclease-3